MVGREKDTSRYEQYRPVIRDCKRTPSVSYLPATLVVLTRKTRKDRLQEPRPQSLATDIHKMFRQSLLQRRCLDSIQRDENDSLAESRRSVPVLRRSGLLERFERRFFSYLRGSLSSHLCEGDVTEFGTRGERVDADDGGGIVGALGEGRVR